MIFFPENFYFLVDVANHLVHVKIVDVPSTYQLDRESESDITEQDRTWFAKTVAIVFVIGKKFYGNFRKFSGKIFFKWANELHRESEKDLTEQDRTVV